MVKKDQNEKRRKEPKEEKLEAWASAHESF
jgi:hypothetical protein